ncbi:MAG: type IX secretion system protein PorQ [Bacteroidales bacterium]
MAKRIILIVIFSTLALSSYPQTGGDDVYEFLNLTYSGLVSSAGGSNVSLTGRNINLSWFNPSLLDRSMDHSLALNYVNYFAGINYGMAMYSHSLPSDANIAGGIVYLNYGSFTGADESGNITGSFSASEYAFSFIYSRELDSAFAVGVNIKPVVSHLEKYTSLGFAFDLGVSWHNRSNLLSAGLVIRNIGYQITRYAGEPRRNPPFEIEAGASARLAHAPLGFSLTLRHLEKFDLTYTYDETTAGGEIRKEPAEFFENLARHVILSAELIPYKSFYLSAGYNYQRRSELSTGAGAGGAGLSWGFGINTSVIDIEFGRASYHLAGSSNNISLIVRPSLLYKKMAR